MTHAGWLGDGPAPDVGGALKPGPPRRRWREAPAAAPPALCGAHGVGLLAGAPAPALVSGGGATVAPRPASEPAMLASGRTRASLWQREAVWNSVLPTGVPGRSVRRELGRLKRACACRDLRFTDAGLESDYQAFKSELEQKSNFDTMIFVFTSLIQGLALRRQWGHVGLFDHLLMTGGILVPMGVQLYKGCFPEAYAKRRFLLRSVTKIICLNITRRVSTYGSRAHSLTPSWMQFLRYTSLYGRLVFLAMSVLFLQVHTAPMDPHKVPCIPQIQSPTSRLVNWIAHQG